MSTRRRMLPLVLATTLGVQAQIDPPTADYFPMELGSVWTYAATNNGVTKDLSVTNDGIDMVSGRTSFGHYARVLVPGQGVLDDRTREYRSMSLSGLHLDRTFVEPQLSNNYTIDWNGLNIVGPTLVVGSRRVLAAQVNVSMPPLQWNGPGNGTATVLARETITVPAGTFETYKIEIFYSYSAFEPNPIPPFPGTISGIHHTSLWVASGFGVVRQVSDVVSSLSGQHSVVTWELKSAALTGVHDLSGRIKFGTTNGPGIPGIEVLISNLIRPAATATTASDGSYRFPDRVENVYTVTPMSSIYTFDPPNHVFGLNDDTVLPVFVGRISSLPPPRLRPSATPDGIGFEWDSLVGASYRVLRSDTGGVFTDTGAGPFPGTGGPLSFEESWPAGTRPERQLYQVEATALP